MCPDAAQQNCRKECLQQQQLGSDPLPFCRLVSSRFNVSLWGWAPNEQITQFPHTSPHSQIKWITRLSWEWVDLVSLYSPYTLEMTDWVAKMAWLSLGDNIIFDSVKRKDLTFTSTQNHNNDYQQMTCNIIKSVHPEQKFASNWEFLLLHTFLSVFGYYRFLI